MNRSANIYMKEMLAGKLEEIATGYAYTYNEEYLANTNAVAVSSTIKLQKERHESNVLFPFFDGLIPEGWLLDIAEKNWKLNEKDRMGLLLACCKNCIGAVSVIEII
jgi:serine/threonine-protein kinase HipA